MCGAGRNHQERKSRELVLLLVSLHALTALIKTYGKGKLGQPTVSVNAEQTASLKFMCDLEFKNADFVLVDGLVKENTLIAWGEGRKENNIEMRTD